MLRDRNRLVDRISGETHRNSGLTSHHVQAGCLDDRALGYGVRGSGYDSIRGDARTQEADSDDNAERWHLSRLGERYSRRREGPQPTSGGERAATAVTVSTDGEEDSRRSEH